MNRRELKQKRDKLSQEIDCLKMVDGNFNYTKIIQDKKKKYNFYNNLMKTMGGKNGRV